MFRVDAGPELEVPNDNQLNSQFHEQKLIEQFCRQTQLLKLVEGSSGRFVANYRQSRRPEDLLAPIQMRLDFNYSQLIEHSPKLLQFIVEEPLQFAEAVRYSIYGLVRSHLKSAGLKAIDINQLHAQWRLVGLPHTPGLQFEPRDYSLRLGLAQIQGILAAFTPQETLVLQSIWYCGSGCMRNAIQTSSTDAPLCSGCSRPMSEYQKLRVTETYRLLAILPSFAVQTPRITGCLHRPKIVRLRAHAHDCDLKLGASYLITCYFSGSATTYQLEACHLESN
ncbi:uncharacterized protein LOC108097985 isoform X2 [Drosophila ficusphila]|uniref:uncharacterized protein LOC108097985 isoform X2 n=1 Tax=Drosophila ficusphila TaxID=30025 RepID=UPI0007E7BADE|nr:uncharacterized protein LOC108097985 isoform X2 [Drosophila ficusphila]